MALKARDERAEWIVVPQSLHPYEWTQTGVGYMRLVATNRSASRWAYRRGRRVSAVFAVVLMVIPLAGCYVPLRSPGVPASVLPASYRTPMRSVAPRLNLADLAVAPPFDYILGPYDTLEISIPRMYENANLRTVRAKIMFNGNITLPMVGDVEVAGLNLAQAQHVIERAFGKYLSNPQISLDLAEKATIPVSVIGKVNEPGSYSLPKYQNDIANAIAIAGGPGEFAGQIIEVHRRLRDPVMIETGDAQSPHVASDRVVLQIPLLGGPPTISTADGGVLVREQLQPEDVTLQPGDVVLVPRQKDEVFFVVGELDDTRVVNFRVQDRDRSLGNAFLLPVDRDVDVVTAVAMAGYIDPINSPSTVTVHRSMQYGGPPLLVHVDLIKARYDWNENIYIQPGDIIYLNPDPAWWMRRTFDRIVPDLLTLPYGEAAERWINPNGQRN